VKQMMSRCLRLVALLLVAGLLLSGLALAGLVPAALAASAAARELGGNADPSAGCWLGRRPAR
jgi:CHASE1-domain containing sensor protein